MDDGAGGTATSKALAMLSAFASVGANAFNLTLTDIEGQKIEGGYRTNCSLEELRRTVGRVLQNAERHQHNVIIRPRPVTTTLIQLDDLDFAKAERIAPHAFIVFQTSPANYQAWVAVEKDAPENFGRRLRKGTGADPTASGSTRIAGSLNFKTKYEPAFPLVELIRLHAGNVTNCTDLEQRGFVAHDEEPQLPRNRASKPSDGCASWPNYQRCIQRAPKARGEDRPDVSRADFVWARAAYYWGHSVDDIAVRLMELSSKARAEGERYAVLTAQNAARSVDRQSKPSKSTPAPRL